MNIADFTERELIARIQRKLPVAPSWMAVGIGDDAAVVEPERNRLEVMTVDAVVDGVHFDRCFTPPQAIGHRALAVNLSDLAAMGAAPRLALLSLSLPSDLTLDDFDAILDGIVALAATHQVHLAGGNITRTPGPLTIDITVIGTVKRRQVLTRSGARAGDDIYVSGTLGAAAAGLRALKHPVEDAEDGARRAERFPLSASSSTSASSARYLYPEPRVRLGLLLGRNRAATACIDLSDGLADGVRRITEASGVGATIEASAIPIGPGAREMFSDNAVIEVMSRGDDYELLFTVRPRHAARLSAARRHGGVALTRIGTCTADGILTLAGGPSSQPFPTGYSHFR
jgi:thiamine-monophosphate kinase